MNTDSNPFKIGDKVHSIVDMSATTWVITDIESDEGGALMVGLVNEINPDDTVADHSENLVAIEGE